MHLVQGSGSSQAAEAIPYQTTDSKEPGLVVSDARCSQATDCLQIAMTGSRAVTILRSVSREHGGSGYGVCVRKGPWPRQPMRPLQGSHCEPLANVEAQLF